jgi:hypothetical protein
MRAPALKTAIAVLAACAAAALAGSTFSAFSSASSNIGSTFATAATFNTCPNTTISSGHVTGYESGRFPYSSAGLWPQGSGMTIDSTTVRTGSYSLRMSPAGAVGNTVWWYIPAPTTVVMRFALRFNTLPAGNVSQLASATGGGGASIHLRYVAASQKLALAITGATGGTPVVGTASTTVSAGTWHIVEYRWSVGTTTHAADWQIDEVSQPGVTVAGTATAVGQTYLGSQVAETYTAYYDDVLITNAGAQYPHGAGRVHTLVPNGMGTHVGAANFTDNDGTAIDATSWQRLDEIPTENTTDWIQMLNTGGSDYAEILFANTTETCIRAVQGTMATHSPAQQANNAKVSVFDGATETVLKSGNFSANVTVSRDYGALVVPAGAWSQTALNGLVGRFGYASDANPDPFLDGLLLEYEVPQ